MAQKHFVSFVLVFVFGGIDRCQGSSFLGGTPTRYGSLDPKVQRILFETESYFGHGNVKRHVAEIEDLLRGVYNSLSKNANGRLGTSGVRYALHRLFAQKHGWLVEGLDANGGSWNASSPTAFLQDRVPAYLQGMFEEHLGEYGFDLHEVALLAVSLENLVRAETIARMEATYAAIGLATDADLTEEQVDQIMETSFMIYLFETNLTQASEWVKKVKMYMDEVYPGWQDTLAFLRDERQNIAYTEKDVRNPFTTGNFNFEHVLHVAEGIHDKYGHFQDIECYTMKNQLLAHEYKSTGRVLLSDFYGLALAGDWRYSESVDYLRQLGALDESDSSQPSIIVPNYVYGKSMCLAASSYYSVCCLDECERLLGHLEHTFAMPAVEPSRLAAEVSILPSSTVVAPRNLSEGLRERLHAIADLHGGAVPLHGRLFSQFMHHAYPRECPFPHVSGTINPVTSEQWGVQMNASSSAADEVIKELGRLPEAPKLNGDADDLDSGGEVMSDWHEALPWTNDEELVVMFKPVKVLGRQWTRGLFMVAAVMAMAAILWQTVRTARVSVGDDSTKKVFV